MNWLTQRWNDLNSLDFSSWNPLNLFGKWAQGYLLLFILMAVTVGLLLLLGLMGLFIINMNRNHQKKAAYWQQLESRWEPLLLEVLAGEMLPQDLWPHVAPEEQYYLIDFLMRYARRLRGDSLDLVSEVARPYLKLLVSRLHKGDTEQRARAVQTISVLGLHDHTDDIAEMIDDPSPFVAMLAARSLAYLKNQTYLEAILRNLPRFENWNPRFLASMFASMGHDVSPRLREILSDPQYSPPVRAVIGRALADIHAIEAVAEAEQVLKEEPNSRELVLSALNLIGLFGTTAHLKQVYPLLESTDFVIRAYAIKTLGHLDALNALPILEQGLEDESPWVALQAGWAMRAIGLQDKLKALAHSDHPRAAIGRQIMGI